MCPWKFSHGLPFLQPHPLKVLGKASSWSSPLPGLHTLQFVGATALMLTIHLTIVANCYQDTGTGRRRVWSPQDPNLWRCASHSPLTHTECQPPAATSAMGRPCSASNSLGSSSASRVPWPSCPCLSKGTRRQLQSHQGVSLAFLQRSHSPTRTCSPPISACTWSRPTHLPPPQEYTRPASSSSNECSAPSSSRRARSSGARGR